MDLFPTEVWIHIVMYACNDNGSTGRALSQTCWDLYEIAKPHKLHSISVVGAKQIVKFAAAIERTPVPFRYVRNLFVASTNPRLTPSYASSMGPEVAEALQALNFSSHESEYSTQESSSDSTHPSSSMLRLDEQAISEGFHRILELVASTLITLHVHFTFITRTSILIPVSLPSLKELTLYGPFQFKSGPTLHSLRRLHLGHYPALDPRSILSQLAPTAPYITHVCLHGPRSGSHTELGLPEPAQWVHGLIQRVERSWEEDIASRLKLFIEVDPASLLLTGLPLINLLRQIASADSRVKIIDARKNWVDISMAERDWLERNIGEDGRWK